MTWLYIPQEYPPAHEDPINILSLCTGVGGLELGVKLALPTARTVCCVEREAYAAAVLVARMEEQALDPAPIWDDVTTFDGKRWRGSVDLITAGYPCQPESTAGKQLGEADPRWLWNDIWRIICDVQPRYVFLENVAAHRWGSFKKVVGQLAAGGWRVEWDCISAANVGAPHRRDRLFILAANPDGANGRIIARQTDAPHDGAQASLADASDNGLHRSTLVRVRAEANADVTDRCGSAACVRGSAAWEDADVPQPAVRRVDDGLANRVDRLYCIGNGVVPQAAAKAWSVLRARLDEPVHG